jgi:hypothetical protein
MASQRIDQEQNRSAKRHYGKLGDRSPSNGFRLRSSAAEISDRQLQADDGHHRKKDQRCQKVQYRHEFKLAQPIALNSDSIARSPAFFQEV